MQNYDDEYQNPDPRYSQTCSSERPSKCDLYRPGDKNLWVEKGTGPDDDKCPGVCLLDTYTKANIIYILERDPRAAQDLLKVTSDCELRKLAGEIPRLPVVELDDAEQNLVNKPSDPNSNPFYGLFRGNPPVAQ